MLNTEKGSATVSSWLWLQEFGQYLRSWARLPLKNTFYCFPSSCPTMKQSIPKMLILLQSSFLKKGRTDIIFCHLWNTVYPIYLNGVVFKQFIKPTMCLQCEAKSNYLEYLALKPTARTLLYYFYQQTEDIKDLNFFQRVIT